MVARRHLFVTRWASALAEDHADDVRADDGPRAVMLLTFLGRLESRGPRI
jgi:hypothetical protein